MGLSEGRKSVRIGLAVLIQYRSVTDTQPPSHVAVAITLNAQASSLKMIATSGFLTALECTKFVFGRGSAPNPAGGAYSAPPDTLAGLRESYF